MNAASGAAAAIASRSSNSGTAAITESAGSDNVGTSMGVSGTSAVVAECNRVVTAGIAATDRSRTRAAIIGHDDIRLVPLPYRYVR
jgi:hypothetical protein